MIAAYAGIGDNDGAFEWLERAYGERDGIVYWLKAAQHTTAVIRAAGRL